MNKLDVFFKTVLTAFAMFFTGYFGFEAYQVGQVNNEMLGYVFVSGACVFILYFVYWMSRNDPFKEEEVFKVTKTNHHTNEIPTEPLDKEVEYIEEER